MIRRKMIRRENDESLINDVCGNNNNNNNDYKMKNNKVKDKERNDKAVYRKGFNDKVESDKAKVLESRFL